MPAYRYEAFRSPFVGSISDLVAREGEIRARAAMESGQAWAGAAQNIGNTVSTAVTTATDPRRQADQIALTKLKDEQASEAALTKLQTPTTPTGPMPAGETAAPQNPYLDKEGDVSVWNVGKLQQAMAAQGKSLTPALMKQITDFNQTTREEMAHRQQFAGTQQKLVSQAAGIMAGFVRAHPDIDLAQTGKMIGDQFAANGSFPMDKFNAALAQVTSDPQTALAKLDALSQIGAEDMTVNKDAIVINRNNPSAPPLASNIVPEKPTEASLAADAATLGTNHETKTAKDSAAAIAKLKPPPPRSEQEQALDAYAKSIGKTRSEDLTDAERQAYVARDAKLKAAQAFQQHVVEHTYDVNHPAPIKGKSQDELEQEARGVLRAEFSSRSGGLGIEDQKVNQAIHLRALIDQYDGKNMPAQIQAELALGLARLTSPGGTVGAELEKEFNQRTAEGGVSKAVAWITGDPTLVNATPEKLREMFADSINRQGMVAQQNRQTYLNEMIAMLPTQLEKNRRDAIVASVKPTTMPAPKGAPADGTQRNGATWKNGAQGWAWYR